MLELVVLLLLIVALVMAWQHIRYLRIRRSAAQDRQRILHSGDVFHVIVFFRLKSGDKLIDAVRRFAQRITSTSQARLIYAGQAAFTVSSQHLGSRDWDGVVLFEYPSRPAYELARANGGNVEARLLFADSYVHAMRRNRQLSLNIPQFLLRIRLKDLLIGRWRPEPLQTSLEFATSPQYAQWRSRVSRLRALHEINRQGLVVFNLIRYGPTGYQGALDAYGGRLLSRMAALGYGPLHVGRSVALEELASFNRVYIVYFPSARYYADMLASQFFNSIAGSKHLGDTIRVPTVPITAHL